LIYYFIFADMTGFVSDVYQGAGFAPYGNIAEVAEVAALFLDGCDSFGSGADLFVNAGKIAF
jgi:hypothetical protein